MERGNNFCLFCSCLTGALKPQIMNYFLEDDTLEIMEINEKNAGKDPFPKLLRRCRLPRKVRDGLLGELSLNHNLQNYTKLLTF